MGLSSQEWWAVIEAYGEAIFPAQIIFASITLILSIIFIIKPGKLSSIFLKIFFSVSFLWIGIIFFLLLGIDLGPVHIGQGISFCLLGVLFGVDIFTNWIKFKIPEKIWKKVVFYVLLSFAHLYPVVGWLVGHKYPGLIFNSKSILGVYKTRFQKLHHH